MINFILKIKSLIKNLDEYETILFHKFIAQVQRRAYKSHISLDNLKNKILIEVDYKQKIKIGMSPRQISSEYFNQKERTCLGILLFLIIFDKFFD